MTVIRNSPNSDDDDDSFIDIDELLSDMQQLLVYKKEGKPWSGSVASFQVAQALCPTCPLVYTETNF